MSFQLITNVQEKNVETSKMTTKWTEVKKPLVLNTYDSDLFTPLVGFFHTAEIRSGQE